MPQIVRQIVEKLSLSVAGWQCVAVLADHPSVKAGCCFNRPGELGDVPSMGGDGSETARNCCA